MTSPNPTTRSTSISRTRSIPTLRSRPAITSTTTTTTTTSTTHTHTSKPAINGQPGPASSVGTKSLLRKPSMPLRGASSRPAIAPSPRPATSLTREVESKPSTSRLGLPQRGNAPSPRPVETGTREVERKPSTSRLGPGMGLPQRATTATAIQALQATAGSKMDRKPLPARSMLDLRRMNAAAASVSTNPSLNGTKATGGMKVPTSRSAPGKTVAPAPGPAPRADAKTNPLGPKRTILPSMSSSTRVAPSAKPTAGLLGRKASMPILSARPAVGPSPRVDNVFSLGPSASLAASKASGAVGPPAKLLGLPSARSRVAMVVQGKRFTRTNATPTTPSPLKRPHPSTIEAQTPIRPSRPLGLSRLGPVAPEQEFLADIHDEDPTDPTSGPNETPLLPRLMGRTGQSIAFEHLPMIADESFTFEGSISTSSVASSVQGGYYQRRLLGAEEVVVEESGRDSLDQVGEERQKQEQAIEEARKRQEQEERARKEKEMEREAEELKSALAHAQTAMKRMQAERDGAVLAEKTMREEVRAGKLEDVQREIEAELQRTREYREMLGIWQETLLARM